MIEQAFEVGRDQNVHAGRSGLEELPLGGVSTRGEEIRQNIVLVGSTDQLAHGQAHLFGVIARQNVAEITRRDTEIHFIAVHNFPGLEQLSVSGKIVDDLRHKTSPVDGVGAGKADIPLSQPGRNGLVAKDFLDARLGIVKVAAHGIDSDIFALLGSHLQALDLTGAARGVEHRDLHTGDIMVAVQSRLSGIAAGRHQDQGLLGAAKVLLGLHQQLRHQLQGVILERAGRAMPQLQRIDVLRHRSQIARLAAERCTIGRFCCLCQELFGIIRQVFPHDDRCHLRVIQCTKCLDIHLRKACRDKQAALVGQALCNRLRRGHHAVTISCAVKLHDLSLLFYQRAHPLAPSYGSGKYRFLPFSHRSRPIRP